MDLYDKDEQAPQGSADNAGHSVAIVGYVLPADGNTNKAPYYQVWNPWWGQTFYVSSQSDTIRLAGMNYQWSRTWHNWRKTTSTASINLDSTIEDQKVASASHPSFSPVYSTPTTPFKPLGENINYQTVSHMGAEISVYAPFYGITFAYSQSLDLKKMRARWNKKIRTSEPLKGSPISNFSNGVDNLISLGNQIVGVIGGNIAYFVAILTVAAVFPEAAIIANTLKSLGVIGGGVDLMAIVKSIISYVNTVKNLKSDFNSI